MIPRFGLAVVHLPFDSFAEQCNFGLGLISTPWCLSLDADHRITPAFQARRRGSSPLRDDPQKSL